jgi:SHAQKYF class myb-like DNA-binding protein
MTQNVLEQPPRTSSKKGKNDLSNPCVNDGPSKTHRGVQRDENLSDDLKLSIPRKKANGTTSPNHIKNYIEFATLSNIISNTFTKLGVEKNKEYQLAPTRLSVSALSRSNPVENSNRATGDANDMIASIAANARASSETKSRTTQNALQMISKERLDPSKSISYMVLDSTDDTTEQQQDKRQKHKQKALHASDDKMPDDDTLLRDVPWNTAQHKDFVAAIFEVGLKTCSPSAIMENMRTHPRYITRERTKSHLQKYRITKDRNKDDFMSEYSAFMHKTEAIKNKYLQSTNQEALPKVILSKVLNGKKPTKLIGGQAAALLSFSVLNNCSTDYGPDQIPFNGTKATFPNLTEEEKQSSLGVSLLLLKRLLHNMTDVLLKERHGIPNVPNSNSEEYDSQSSYEDEDSDFEGDERKPASNPLRHPLPVEGGTSSVQHRPGKLPNHGSYSHHATCYDSPRTRFQQPYATQGHPGFHPPFPPFAYGGPPRPMPSHHGIFPPHRPHLNHGPYSGHAPLPEQLINHYPAGTHHNTPYARPADVTYGSYLNQAVRHQQQQGAAAFPSNFLNHEEVYSNIVSQEQYDGNSEPIHGEVKDSQHEWVVENDGSYRNKWRRHCDTIVETDHPEEIFHGEKRNRYFTDDPTIVASPLVAERKRTRKYNRDHKVTSLDVSSEIDEDRGIPGASKVASPFHEYQCPVRPKSKKPVGAERKRGRHGSRSGNTTQKPRRSQSPMVMKSPCKDINEDMMRTSYHINDGMEPTPQKMSQSCTQQPDKALSPEMFFSGEPHLSPDEMSMVSKASHDGHPLVWEPLAIDMHEHFLAQDHYHKSSGFDHPKESPIKVTRTTKSDKHQIRNDSRDTPTSKRGIFYRNKGSSDAS